MARLARTLIAFAMIAVPAAASGQPTGAIQVLGEMPYRDRTVITTKILDSCTALGTKLSSFLQQYASNYGVDLVVVDSIDTASKGRVLRVQVTNAFSSGNAFIGHRKSMSAEAELFENGESIGSVNYTRDSGGGFGAGFKGSCSVLGRCAKALGKDIATWLRDR